MPVAEKHGTDCTQRRGSRRPRDGQWPSANAVPGGWKIPADRNESRRHRSAPRQTIQQMATKCVADLETASAKMRPARWHGDFLASSPARRRPCCADGAECGGTDRRQRPGLVSQRVFPLSEERDRTDASRCHRPHRRQHEWPARRLLHAGQDARHGRAALTRRPLASDSGWRSSH